MEEKNAEPLLLNLSKALEGNRISVVSGLLQA